MALPKRCQRTTWVDKENNDPRALKIAGQTQTVQVLHLTVNRTANKKKHATDVLGIAPKRLKLMKPPKQEAKPARIPMPFLQKTSLYDEHWTFKQERAFTKWLNHILAPIDDHGRIAQHDGKNVFSSTTSIQLSDSSASEAKCLNESQHKMSINAYRILLRQRRAACLLYQSEPILLMIPRLEAEIESQQLCMRPDKCPHADVGIKHDILESLLHAYHPLWLRLGLEVVFGEMIQVGSNDNIIQVLGSFLSDRLLKNCQIADTYSHPIAPHCFREGYSVAVSQYIVKKFILLVVFLDRAKLTRLIDHDPCLFQLTSSIKSSRDMLQTFSSKYLAGEGDIIKHLLHMGFAVTQTQTALDEYDYVVTNLAVDLRDGLRLVRLVEVLTFNWKLSKQLRVPAATKMQKLHNIQVALKALEEHLPLPAGVTAESIVEGHKEKTLTLLWSIIFHFKVKLLLSEEDLKEEIDHLEKQKRVYGICNRSTDELALEPNMFFEPTLSLLLQWCKAVCVLYGVPVNNFNSSFSDGRALCYLIHHYHPQLLTLESIKDETTLTQSSEPIPEDPALMVNECNGAWSATFSPTTGHNKRHEELLENEKYNFRLLAKTLHDLGGIPPLLQWRDMSNTLPNEKVVIAYVSYLCHQMFVLRKEIRAVLCIQRAWWRYKQRCALGLQQINIQKAVITIQAWLKGYLARKDFHNKRSSATVLQRWWRGICLMKEQYMKFVEMRKAALTIQQAFRLHRMNKAAIIITSVVRAYLVRRRFTVLKALALRMQRNWRDKQKHYAATVIQAAMRGYQAKRNGNRRNNAAIVIQRAFKRWVARRSNAASILQKWYRGAKETKKERALFLTKKTACEKIQMAFRIYQQQRHLEYAARVVQRVYRTKQQRLWYLKLRHSAVIIQHHYRIHQHKLVIQRQNAAIIIQACVRRYLARHHYCKSKHSIILLQSHFRAHLASKQYRAARLRVIKVQACARAFLQRRRYIQLCKSVTLVQALYRQHIAQKKFRDLKRSVITVQAYARGYLVRRRVTMMKESAVIIQSHVRGFLAKRRYIQMRAAAVILQSHVRRRIAQMKYSLIRRSIIKMQAFIRGYLAWSQFQKSKEAAVIIQSHIRTFLATKHYTVFREATVRLQAHARGCIARRKIASLRTSTCKSAIVIQRHIRGYLARRCYKEQRASAVIIQACFRGYMARKKYSMTRKAIIVVQAVVRGHLAHSHYQKMRKSAIILQSHARQLLARRSYMKCRQAVIKIQAVLRGHQTRCQYKKTISSIISAQSYVRMYLARLHFQQDRESVITVQACCRGYLARKNCYEFKKSVTAARAYVTQHLAYLKLAKQRDAAIAIQSYWRMFTSRTQYSKFRNATVIFQARARAFLARKKSVMLKASVITIQTQVRGFLARRKYQKLRVAAILLQSHVKKIIAQRKYSLVRRSIIKMQAFIRGYLTWSRFQKSKEAAVIIQSHIRTFLATKHYRVFREATVRLQAHARGCIARRKIASLRASTCKSAIVIQRHVRGFLARSCYKEQRASAVIIQACFRGYMARKKYSTTRNAIIVVQAVVRGHLAHSHYQKMRKSAIILQSHARQLLARRSYMKCRQAVIKIQAALHGYQTRCQYKKTISSIISAQSYVRMYLARLHFQQDRESVITVQACCRGYLARKNCYEFKKSVTAARAYVTQHLAYLKLAKQRDAAIAIQSYWRMFTCRTQYSKFRKATVIFQEHARTFLVRKKAAMSKTSAIVIQTKVRGFLARRRYKKLRDAIVLLQAHTRGCLARQKVLSLRSRSCERDFKPKCEVQSHSIAEMHKAATVVQATWRGWHVRKHQKSPDIKKALVNVHAVNSSACESNQLKHCLPHLLEQLLHCKYLSTAAELLNRLVTMTEVSEKCSQVVLKILLNICKWPATAGSVFQDNHSLSIFVDFMAKIYLSHHENMELMCQLLSQCVHSKNVSALKNVDCRKLKSIKDTLEKKSKMSQGKCHRTYANNLQCIKQILKVASEV
ncbi:hypothetical protein EMCRGX_G018068 [Ephydatia muelleri]